MSYIVLPKNLIKKYQKEYLFYTQSVSRMDQEVIRKFLHEGYWENIFIKCVSSTGKRGIDLFLK